MSTVSSISQSTHVLRDCEATLVVETPSRYSFEDFPLKPAKSDGHLVYYVTKQTLEAEPDMADVCAKMQTRPDLPY
eukprot:1012813-Amphidinium_carterae.1